MSTAQLIPLVQTFVLSRQAAGLSPRTVEFYDAHLHAFLDALPPNPTADHLNASAIEGYLAQRQQEVKPRSVHAAWRAIRAFCNWMQTRQEQFPEWTNPVPHITGPKLPRKKVPPIERDALDKLVKACKGHNFLDHRDKAIFLVLASSGLRASELLSLRQGDVNLNNGLVHIEQGKGGADRIAIVSRKARLALADYLGHLERRKPATPLWWSQRGPLTYSGLASMMRKRAEEADVPRPGAHAFRRRWATDMVPKLGTHVVQALGGWADVASMRPYVQLRPEDLLDAYESNMED